MQTTTHLRRLLPDYRLISLIGRGLGGETWLAEGPQGPVAIKVLSKRTMQMEGAFSQMLGEAMVLTTVKHPNVVPYLAFTHDSSQGLAALVMRYIPGGDLEQHVEREGAFTSRQVARLGLMLVSALTALHRAGYLHRDLKPRNILIERAESGELHLFLADFGISQPLVDGVAQAKIRALTPGYAAPEQWETLHLGQGADVYALGAVLWFMHSGRHPGADTGDPDEDGEIVEVAEPLRPPPAPLTDPADIALYAILATMMAHDAEDRPLLPRVRAQLNAILRIPESPRAGPAPAAIAASGAFGLETLAIFEHPTMVSPTSPPTILQVEHTPEARRADPQGAGPITAPAVNHRRRQNLALLLILLGAVGVGLSTAFLLFKLSALLSHDIKTISPAAAQPDAPRAPETQPSSDPPSAAEAPPEIIVEVGIPFDYSEPESDRTPARRGRPRSSHAAPVTPTDPPPTTPATDGPGSAEAGTAAPAKLEGAKVQAEPAVQDLNARPHDTPLPPGRLNVNVTRGWAVIYIDGKQIDTTPISDHELSPGKHVVRAVNEKAGTYASRDIVIESGRTVRVALDLE